MWWIKVRTYIEFSPFLVFSLFLKNRRSYMLRCQGWHLWDSTHHAASLHCKSTLSRTSLTVNGIPSGIQTTSTHDAGSMFNIHFHFFFLLFIQLLQVLHQTFQWMFLNNGKDLLLGFHDSFFALSNYFNRNWSSWWICKVKWNISFNITLNTWLYKKTCTIPFFAWRIVIKVPVLDCIWFITRPDFPTTSP